MEDFKDKNVTIMGLGLHGGGLATAKFFLAEGANITITDLRTKEILKQTIEQLKGEKINYTLGEHIDSDFTNADIVIKNPGVPKTSKYLKLAKRVESDISIFLQRVNTPIIAITGSKGKSSTVSAIYHVLKKFNPKTRLGGNITVSPLTFINDVDETTPVILELSSWQLADLNGKGCLKPKIAAVTNIMNDHQNAYNSLDEYAEDKAVIFQGVTDYAILNYNDKYRDFFKSRLNIKPLYYSNTEEPSHINGIYLDSANQGWSNIEGKRELLLDPQLTLKGEHQRENLLLAALILSLYGVDKKSIRTGLQEFKGIAHRMELFHEKNGVKYYNDSAATIPEAACAAINSFKTPIHLISGGTDKALEFSSIKNYFSKPKSIYLLAGTGTDKMMEVLNSNNIDYFGPYKSLEKLISELKPNIEPGDSVLFSPGATSFGMFNNEFDRGDQFKAIISKI
ncbi:MAG: UDP-N-acetylmuramoyl-L-alanine--D-glutamate ligase [Spirochaetaceae bacterium 4572_7]|nr:MAG: UDP-N-acetylmuramoyl-L-alanine--D-glutamate ligase [Spirochaetaceae bacterium 4572_7]